MAAEVPHFEGSRPEGEETSRSGSFRRVLRWGLVAALLVGILASLGWYGIRHRAYLRDARTAGELNHKVAVLNQSLTDDEFDAALALCDARDTETRFTALIVATGDAIRRNPDRKSRVAPVAVRLLADREATVREKAIRALTGLKSRENLDRIRPLLQAADPKERKAAEEAVAVLEAPEAPK